MPTMNISLTAELASFVAGEVRSGRYASSSELVRESLRLLARERAIDAEEMAALRAAVAEGIADAEAGRFSDFTIEEITARVRSDLTR